MHGGAAGRRRHSIARAASGAIDSFDLTSTHSAMASSVLKLGSLWVCMHCLCLGQDDAINLWTSVGGLAAGGIAELRWELG